MFPTCRTNENLFGDEKNRNNNSILNHIIQIVSITKNSSLIKAEGLSAIEEKIVTGRPDLSRLKVDVSRDDDEISFIVRLAFTLGIVSTQNKIIEITIMITEINAMIRA